MPVGTKTTDTKICNRVRFDRGVLIG
jgi:hypothetical protein